MRRRRRRRGEERGAAAAGRDRHQRKRSSGAKEKSQSVCPTVGWKAASDQSDNMSNKKTRV